MRKVYYRAEYGKLLALGRLLHLVMLEDMTTPRTISDLYPDLSPEREQEVEDAFERYLALILRTYEHIQSVPELYERFRALTGENPSRTIQDGRSFTSQHHDTEV